MECAAGVSCLAALWTVTSVAAALGTTLILRHYNLPPRFISHFTMIAIAITHRHQRIVEIVVASIFAVA
jgi:hypothetical protein